jgi:hypothetical protein
MSCPNVDIPKLANAIRSLVESHVEYDQSVAELLTLAISVNDLLCSVSSGPSGRFPKTVELIKKFNDQCAIVAKLGATRNEVLAAALDEVLISSNQPQPHQ